MDAKQSKGLEIAQQLIAQRQRRARPYYKPEYAAGAKAILDELHRNRVPIRKLAEGISANTLRIQYYQGADYLRDHDTTGHYERLYHCTVCYTKPAYIEWHVRPQRGAVAFADGAVPCAPWREDFLAFLESAEVGMKFNPKDIHLTKDDQEFINGQLSPLSDLFLYKVAEKELLVIRIDPNSK